MSTIIRDDGFHPEDLNLTFSALDELAEGEFPRALDLGADADPAAAAPYIGSAEVIRVDFPSSADGRGFTIAARLRVMGFTGRLRAKGHVLADQYAMARRSGFDEVEIDDALAQRQPEPQWLARADWKAHSYQNRLRATA